MILKRIFIIFILAWMVPATLTAQSESKDLDRIAREQQNIRNRLDHVLKKMDRLRKKNEVEGKEHTADLIRRAEAEIQGREILKRIEDLDAGIRAAQLTVSEEQAALLKDLEDIFAILQDRNDLERLEDLIAAYTEGLVKLDRLIDEQDGLLEETRDLVYDEAALLNDAREKLSRIRKEQERLNARVKETAQGRPSRDDWWKLTEDLEALARRQEDLSERSSSLAESEGSEETKEVGELTEEQKNLAAELDALRERMKSMAEGKNGKAALSEDLKETLERSGEKAGEARDAMDRAVRELVEDRVSAASEEARSASRALREASQALQKAGESDFRERRMEDYELAGRQDLLREEMEDLRSKLEKLESIGKKRAGSEEQSKSEGSESSEESGESSDSAAKAEGVRRDMESARDQLSQGNPDRAEPHQQDALTGLEELDDLLKKRQDRAYDPDEPGSRNQLSSPETYQDLARRQKELEEQTRDLMRRLRELPDSRPRENLSDAADNMSGAADELGAERGDEAEVDQEEAKKHLEKARREMEEEENKYQNIRQQEVLFRVQQALEELKNRQDKILAETADFEASREENSRPTRLERKVLRTLSQQESEVKAKTVEIREKVEEDGSSVFTWVLERNEDDLTEVVDYLDRRESGPVVQTIQQDVSDRFQELIEALKLELKRRMEALAESEAEEQEPMPGGQQPPEQNALIPPVAELLMIKRMEENALRRIEEFARLHPEILDDDIGPMEIRMLERLGHQHSSITDLFDKMLKRSGWQPGPEARPENDETEEKR